MLPQNRQENAGIPGDPEPQQLALLLPDSRLPRTTPLPFQIGQKMASAGTQI